MTGTVGRPGVATGTVDMSSGQTLSPAFVNAFRISAVTCRLLDHVRGEARSNDSEFCNLCLSLARGIDYAVSNNEIPGGAPNLPYLLKQVCQRKNDLTSQAAIMVLMISVKSACNFGWFSEKEKEELYDLSKEMQSSFCSVSVDDLSSNMKNKENNTHPIISTILSRFYPGMKMGQIFSVVETKRGYDSYVTDMYISKSSRISLDDKIYLFVAQTDNAETSSCLITPQQVNFLLNGEGVDRRTCLYKDPGPQMPTPVTHMLKYGSNLLQVVGQFNRRYIIVIGFMIVDSNPNFSNVPDYVPQVAAVHDSDNEIIEGPSKISLKCPISFSRIKIPVKGHSCKHLQCFDFNNYVEINTKRPLWRCPHCSQSVCFQDIRIDQSMVKVLKNVAEDVYYVHISCDGSWQATTETISNEHTENQNDNENEMDITDKDDDKTPSPAGVCLTSSVVNNNIAPRMEDAYCREFYLSAVGSRTTTNTRSDSCDVIHRNRSIFNSLTQGHSQSPIPVSSYTHSQHNNNNNGNAHVRYPYRTPAAWVTGITRTLNAIQALPAQHSARTVLGDRQHNFSRTHLNQHPSFHSQPDHLLRSSQSQTPPQVGSRHTSPFSADRFNSNQHQSLNQRTHTQPSVRQSGQPYPHVRLVGPHGGVGTMTSLASSQSTMHPSATIQRSTSQIMSQSPSIRPPVQTSEPSPGPVAATDQQGRLVDESADDSWRPAGRMRGSLSGWRYTEALKNQSIIQPSQPVQPARPPPVLNTPRPFIPPHLQALMANNPRPQADGSGSGLGSDK